MEVIISQHLFIMLFLCRFRIKYFIIFSTFYEIKFILL